MIYDCFTFFNELDILELRLGELYDKVDKFVLVESTQTFTQKEKPLYFKENKQRYKKYLDKIIHIIVDDFSDIPNVKDLAAYNESIHAKALLDANPLVWGREFHQRNKIMDGLKTCQPEDIIIVSDVDEILNVQEFDRLKDFRGVLGFNQKTMYYYLNCYIHLDMICSKATHFKDLASPQELRRANVDITIENGGWHLSFIGDIEKISHKINSISHQELNTEENNNKEQIAFNIEHNFDVYGRSFDFEILDIDNSFPKYLQDNIEKFQKFIKPKPAPLSHELKAYRNEILKLRRKIEMLNDERVMLLAERNELKSKVENLSTELENNKLNSKKIKVPLFRKIKNKLINSH